MKQHKLSTRFSSRTILAGVLACSVLLNVLVPHSFTAISSNNTLSAILRSQSALLQVFSLTALPLRMVNTLFAEAAAHKKAPAHPDRRAAGTSADYTLSAPPSRSLERGGTSVCRGTTGMVFLYAACRAVVTDAPLSHDTLPWHAGFLLVFLLGIMPRGNIEPSAVIRYNAITIPGAL